MTEPTQQDLKPCPFCGSKGVVVDPIKYPTSKWVECETCFTIVPKVTEWNTRAYDAEIQALKIQLGKCIIQERETAPIAAAHGWRYNPENYTDEKALAAYQKWKKRL